MWSASCTRHVNTAASVSSAPVALCDVAERRLPRHRSFPRDLRDYRGARVPTRARRGPRPVPPVDYAHSVTIFRVDLPEMSVPEVCVVDG
jgi:hypothetical protein